MTWQMFFACIRHHL